MNVVDIRTKSECLQYLRAKHTLPEARAKINDLVNGCRQAFARNARWTWGKVAIEVDSKLRHFRAMDRALMDKVSHGQVEPNGDFTLFGCPAPARAPIRGNSLLPGVPPGLRNSIEAKNYYLTSLKEIYPQVPPHELRDMIASQDEYHVWKVKYYPPLFPSLRANGIFRIQPT